jgi:hypothetical protein
MANVFGRIIGRERETEVETDELDDLDTGFEEGEGTEESAPDFLADFDDDTRTELEAEFAKREAAAEARAQATLRQQAQARGFDFGQDGSLLIADPNKAQGWLPQQPAAQAPPQQPPAQTPPAADLANIPDPTIYPSEHKQWLDAYVAQQVAAATQGHVQQAAQTTQIVQQMAATAAQARAAGALDRLGYGNLAQHPQFAEKFTEALLNVDMSYWQDDTNLARIALSVAPDLGPATPAPPRSRTRSVVDPATVATNLASRAGADAFAPSAGGRAPAPDLVSGEDRAFAQALGISVQEVRALRDGTGESYDSFKTKGKSKRR